MSILHNKTSGGCLMKKLLSVILIIGLLFSIGSFCAVGGNAASNYGVSYPTKSEILSKIKELDIDLESLDSYSKAYSMSTFTPGALDSKSQKKALNFINLYRYIAGIPSDVTLSSEYSEYAQAVSLINAANGYLSHYPEQPAGMNDELYETASYGASKSNIASGFENINYSIMKGWMDDSDALNINRVGHRRWILNPRMKQTGFGEVESYTTMYSFDTSREGTFTGEYVAWPAPNTPLELFSGSAFSVNLGSEYDDPDVGSVRVELSSKTLGQKWVIDSSSPYDLYVDNKLYGMSKCIVFKTVDFTDEDTISVKISGIYKNGKESPISYTVNLFKISELTAEKTTIVMKPKTIAQTGVTASSKLVKGDPYIDWDFDSSGAAFITTEDEIYANKVGRCTITASILYSFYLDLDVVVKDSEFLLGDSDGDEKVSVSDVTMIQQYLADESGSACCDYNCDANGDGVVDICDAVTVQRYLASITTPYDVGESQLD